MEIKTPEQAGEALRQIIGDKSALAESLTGSAAGHKLLADDVALSKFPQQVIIELMSNEPNAAAVLLRAARAHEECGATLRKLRSAMIRRYRKIQKD